MGSVTKQGGKWRGQVCVNRVRRSKLFGTRAEAARWVHATEGALSQTTVPGSKTLAQLLERYEAEITPTKTGKRQEENRIAAFLSSYPMLCAKKLSDIDTPDLARWRDDRLKKVSG